MQKYNLQKNPLKETKIPEAIILYSESKHNNQDTANKHLSHCSSMPQSRALCSTQTRHRCQQSHSKL
jgi:hypothetical protein